MRKLAVVFLLLSGMAEAGIYKCTDASGNMTFSDRPCPGQKQEQIKKDAAPVATDDEGSASGEALGSDFCSKSIGNGKDWLSSMRDVARKNLNSGHMTQAQYDQGMPELKRIEGKLTQRECSQAKGKQRQFFECLNDASNHLAQCMSTYRPY
ncbi:DUF4124 domain-containing protein [Hahella aquimaris]|uniref:DUF4124 domain-containing protein n=1 Tax=Hahella sp. HNIBRBA332 TaxID=3015983 RepID=UPI00273B296E|nr:DUF4124 domain-containing protein [Hahella sp. HNIBRBA332]WLQ13397.1 DUF4124 domain-containing protein [Hahella sp. HNIBRBA332]